MNANDLKNRTKAFAVEIARLCLELPPSGVNKIYSNQLIRCSSSVGANYRAVCRAKSTTDFINKLKIVEEELDESMFFLELLSEFNEKYSPAISQLHKTANQLTAIIVASIITSRKKLNRKS